MIKVRHILVLFFFCSILSCKKGNAGSSNPVADFTFSISNTNILPTLVYFTSSSQYADTYLWDFGDGSTSTLQNPQHSYSSINCFDVKLTITNKNGSASKTEKINITYSSSSIPQVDDAVNNFMSMYNVPGISIAITKDEKLVYS